MFKRLRDLREDSDKKQKEVAHDLGISPATYGQYERGAREMPYSVMVSIADYFGVTLDYLFERSEFQAFPKDISPADYELLQKYKALDARGRRTIRVLLEYEGKIAEQKEKD